MRLIRLNKISLDLRISPKLARFFHILPLEAAECEKISDNRVNPKIA
jgi:hypothetical protein